ncbi:MAG TPA: GatB/YqeY domain-containing protein [Candidatus Onthocola stercorigallinarum]|jgi:uncharacterized protein YqeY|nr:GatB/YqeY domain-containing protein [Candidatus Onthocola stercorigallinarum]
MLEEINNDLKTAMKEHDSFKLSVIRMLKSALQLEQIAKKHELDDSEVTSVIKKQVKLRKDSISEYEKYGKVDSVKDLEKEIEILSSYLPEEMSKEEIEKFVDEVIAEINPESIKEMGKVMKRLNEVLANKNADMSLASSLVKEKLNH